MYSPGILIAPGPKFEKSALRIQVITPIVGNVVLRGKPRSTFCVSVRPWLHSDMHIWVPSFWTLRILEN
jgi:hypothetical protein